MKALGNFLKLYMLPVLLVVAGFALYWALILSLGYINKFKTSSSSHSMDRSKDNIQHSKGVNIEESQKVSYVAQKEESEKDESSVFNTNSDAKSENSKEIDPIMKEELVEVAFVSTKVANIRAKPDTDSKIIAKLPYGTSLVVLRSHNKWSMVRFRSNGKDSVGYILNRLVGHDEIGSLIDGNIYPNVPSEHGTGEVQYRKNTDTYEETIALSSEDKQSAYIAKSAVVNANIANIRERPGEDSMIVAKSPKGRKVEVLGEESGWAKIRYIFHGTSGAREISGYILGKLLSYE